MVFKITLSHTGKLPGTIPVNYSYPLSAALYKIISKGDAHYAQFLHQTGYGKKGLKLLTFSQISCPFKIEDSRMHLLANELHFQAAFHLPPAAENFIKGLFRSESIDIADKTSGAGFTVKSVESLPDPLRQFKSNEVVNVLLKPLSPVVAGLPNEKGMYDFLNPADPRFTESILYNWRSKIETCYDPATASAALLIEGYELTNPTISSGDNLNMLRTEMAIEVIRNIRMHYKSNLFYIEAPTGGGKTNLSALAAIELLKLNEGKYNKVFYIFPFTTLITQTYKSLKETLGLKENEMVELHSNAGMKINSENEDDNYGNDKLNYINHLFVNYPFAFLSHIRFFDILKTNEKETNYLLHRLANSIVIIDELQSYNPQHWDKVIYFIKQYADKFNIKFILMSATLPKLDKLNVIKEQVQDFVYLLPDTKEKYFNNPNFAGRVTFDFELFDRTDLTLEKISDKLFSESELYAEKDFGTAKPLGSVYTIIEFIFKKTASEFYEIIKHTDFFDEIFVLSGTILPHRRKYIINFLKNKSNRKKKILLITTQVVEAGVDIDMDLGFKDRSLIDSDEQLAGRINRNVNKQGCKLFLFNYNKEAIIYGNDKRLELTRKHINQEQYKEILNNKDFDKLYDIVLNDRNEWNDKTMVENFTDYEAKIKSLKFQSVHEDFKLIEQNNISCFVPLNVSVEVDDVIDGQKEMVFTKSELDFLNQYQVFPNEQNEIEGKEVFDVYLHLIKNKQEFVKQKTEEKILQGIMSKFIFSLFASPKIEKQIVLYSDEEKSEYGYKYVGHWKGFYNIETGMRDSDFYSNETQFL